MTKRVWTRVPGLKGHDATGKPVELGCSVLGYMADDTANKLAGEGKVQLAAGVSTDALLPPLGQESGQGELPIEPRTMRAGRKRKAGQRKDGEPGYERRDIDTSPSE